MQTGLHFEAFYVSWISLRKIYFVHIVGQDFRQNPDFAVIINVEGHYAAHDEHTGNAETRCVA